MDSDSDFCTSILKEIKELIAAATEEQCKEILLSLFFQHSGGYGGENINEVVPCAVSCYIVN